MLRLDFLKMTFDPHSSRSVEVPVGMIVDKSTRVYIKNIPVSRLEKESFDTLKVEFQAFGPLELYVLHKDPFGRFTGTAMATYRNPADAKLAIRKMNNMDVDGATLKVSFAKEHGVILANQMTRYQKRDEEVDEAKWTHDKYEMQRIGGDERLPHQHGRGFGRGGFRGGRGGDRGRGGFRGGRGGVSSVDRVGESFERYIAQRDGDMTSTSLAEGPPAPAFERPTANEAE
jgi:RNA recognition motif-containing protein